MGSLEILASESLVHAIVRLLSPAREEPHPRDVHLNKAHQNARQKSTNQITTEKFSWWCRLETAIWDLMVIPALTFTTPF